MEETESEDAVDVENKPSSDSKMDEGEQVVEKGDEEPTIFILCPACKKKFKSVSQCVLNMLIFHICIILSRYRWDNHQQSKVHLKKYGALSGADQSDADRKMSDIVLAQFISFSLLCLIRRRNFVSPDMNRTWRSGRNVILKKRKMVLKTMTVRPNDYCTAN